MMTRADLPSEDTKRWVASRKASVVKAVLCGLISEADALKTYDLSEEEFRLWVEGAKSHGENGLKTTFIQKNKQP